MISGYAAVFYDGTPETEFRLGPGYVERMMPGAFNQAVMDRAQDVVALFNHDMSLVLGRRSAGTLTLRTDDRGLFYEISPAKTSIYQDVSEHQQRGDVIGSSLGFVATDERFGREGSVRVREIHSMRIRDVGPVTYPAYSGTNDVRMVSPDGVALAVPDDVAAEVRSAMSARWNIDIALRARLIRLDTDRLNQLD